MFLDIIFMLLNKCPVTQHTPKGSLTVWVKDFPFCELPFIDQPLGLSTSDNNNYYYNY